MDLIDVQTQDGNATKISVFSSQNNSNNTVIVIFPAMGVRGSYYQILAEHICEEGFDVVTTDLRGIGNSSIRASRKVDFGYHEMIEYDYESIIEKVKTTFPNKKIFLLGHSLGGQLGSLFAVKNPNRLAGLILVACCSVYYKAYGNKQYPTLMVTQFFRYVSVLLGYFPGKKMGFAGTEAKTVMRDWGEQGRTGKYILKNDDFDYESALKNLEIPLLVISFQQDTYAPRSAVEHLFNKFEKNTKKEYIYLKKGDPRNDNLSHFNWAKKPRGVVSIIQKWIT